MWMDQNFTVHKDNLDDELAQDVPPGYDRDLPRYLTNSDVLATDIIMAIVLSAGSPCVTSNTIKAEALLDVSFPEKKCLLFLYAL